VLIKNEDAVSAVLSVVLVLGLLVTIATIIHVTYVPAWKSSAEAEHMDEVFNDFADLKSNVDLLAAISSDSEYSVSQNIRMGGRSVPVISPRKSSATLRTNPQAHDLYITVDNHTTNFTFSDLGSIEFESNNLYEFESNNLYEFDRKYIYENGALILEEMGRSTIALSPAITFAKPENGTKSLTIQIINMSLDNESVSSSNIEKIIITSESSSTHYSNFTNNVRLTITSNYAPAWEAFLISRANDAGFNSSDYHVTTSGDVELNIHGDLFLTLVETRVTGRINPPMGTVEPAVTASTS